MKQDPNLDLSHFFDLAVDMLCIANLEGYFKKINNQWEKHLGYTEQELLSKPFIEFVHPQDKKATLEAMLILKKGKEVSEFTNRYITKKGDCIWLSWDAKVDPANNMIFATARNVTKFKRIEKSLEVMEEVTGVGVWELDIHTNKPLWSRKIHEIHETDPEKYIPNLEEAINFYDPKGIPKLKKALLHLEKTGEPYNIELPFITAEKNNIMVNARGFAELKDGEVVRNYGIFKDITEELKQKEYNERINERMKLALQASSTGVWELNISTGELSWDDKMFEIYGRKKESFSNQLEDWIISLHPDDVEKATLEFQMARETLSQFKSKFRIITSKGEVRNISALASFIYNEENEELKVTGVNWDVTEQEKIKETLIQEKIKAEEANLAKSSFIANVSHEIRTPMNGILGGLQLLEKNISDQKNSKIIDNSLKSTKSLINIINDILDFSKITANKLELEILNVNIKEIVQDTINEQEFRAKEKNIKLEFNYQADNFWKCDPTRIKQILNNLISNAVKFTKQGSVEINVFEKNNQLEIMIKDSGIGIEKENIDKLFQPFSQADETTTRNYGGTGLGLSISKKLTKLMKGKLTLESEIGKGTTFFVSLPFEKGEEKIIEKEIPKMPDLSNKLILIAEDNRINQVLIMEILKESNAKLIMTQNGKDLVKAYKKKKPDLILSDIQMPVMDGGEACLKLRELDSKIPIIAFTANVMKEDIKKYLANGFTDIIGKPVLMEELIKILKKYT